MNRLREMAHHEARGHVMALATLSVVSVGGTMSAPFLLDLPLLLVSLSPRLAFLALAAKQASLAPFLLVGTLRLALGDPLHFDLGRRYGDSALRRLPRRLEGWVRRSGRFQRPVCAAMVFVRPNGRHLAWAGSQGLPAPLVATLDLSGTMGYLALVHAGAGGVHWP